MPNPLPLALMKLHSEVILVNSPALRVAGRNAVSVNAIVAGLVEVLLWSVVPQASMPDVSAPGDAAELAQLPPTGVDARSLMTMEFGTAGVRVLLIRSVFAESETSPLGVTGHEQQEINCSSGENVYTLAHKAPVVDALVPDARPAPRAPEFVILTTESPMLRLDA